MVLVFTVVTIGPISVAKPPHYMMHYNNDNIADCSAVNAQTFETRQNNTV